MDYNPVNLAPKGVKQGDLLHHDDRAVRLLGHRVRLQAARRRHRGRVDELAKIAARGAEPGLDYGTDEDLFARPTRSSTGGTWAPTR